MFHRNENRDEGTLGCSPGTKTGTRVRSHVPPERKPLRNRPFISQWVLDTYLNLQSSIEKPWARARTHRCAWRASFRGTPFRSFRERRPKPQGIAAARSTLPNLAIFIAKGIETASMSFCRGLEGVTERGGTVLRTSQHFTVPSRLLQKKIFYSTTLWKPFKISENPLRTFRTVVPLSVALLPLNDHCHKTIATYLSE